MNHCVIWHQRHNKHKKTNNISKLCLIFKKVSFHQGFSAQKHCNLRKTWGLQDRHSFSLCGVCSEVSSYLWPQADTVASEIVSSAKKKKLREEKSNSWCSQRKKSKHMGMFPKSSLMFLPALMFPRRLGTIIITLNSEMLYFQTKQWSAFLFQNPTSALLKLDNITVRIVNQHKIWSFET